jgi:hypothetical protein
LTAEHLGVSVSELSCLLQEAADLSSLKPKLDELGIPLYAVVKEHVRTEVKDFQPYFKGEVFLDEKVCMCELVGYRQVRMVLSCGEFGGPDCVWPGTRGWPPLQQHCTCRGSPSAVSRAQILASCLLCYYYHPSL